MRLGAVLLACLGACGAHAASPTPPTLPARVVADFERAVRAGPAAYAELFDYEAVGKFETLLHPYDLDGRAALTPEQRAQFEAESADAPYPPARERRNLGLFFPILAQRTVGSGGCTPSAPVDSYVRQLGEPFGPLPAGKASYAALRDEVNARLATGGIVGLTCRGGRGGLVLVYVRADRPSGYALMVLYDDVGVPGGE